MPSTAAETYRRTVTMRLGAAIAEADTWAAGNARRRTVSTERLAAGRIARRLVRLSTDVRAGTVRPARAMTTARNFIDGHMGVPSDMADAITARLEHGA